MCEQVYPCFSKYMNFRCIFVTNINHLSSAFNVSVEAVHVKIKCKAGELCSKSSLSCALISTGLMVCEVKGKYEAGVFAFLVSFKLIDHSFNLD